MCWGVAPRGWGWEPGGRGCRGGRGRAPGCCPPKSCGGQLAAGRLVPVLAAGSLELAESLAQAGPVPVAGTKQHQDQQQQEAEEQSCGQGPGGCGVQAGLKVSGAENPTPRKEQGTGSQVRGSEKGGVRGPRVREPAMKGREKERGKG